MIVFEKVLFEGGFFFSSFEILNVISYLQSLTNAHYLNQNNAHHFQRNFDLRN